MSLQQSVTWWKAHQAKNLEALSSALASDLEPFLLPEESSPVDVSCVAARQMMKSFLKKFEYDVNPSAEAAALEKFKQVNNDCLNWTPGSVDDELAVLLGEFKDSIYRFYYSGENPIISSFSQILDYGRCGPGNSLGANGDDFYSKLFSSTLTTTSEGLYTAYSIYTESHPIFLTANLIREEEYGDFRIVEGNRLSFVPKNVDVSRCICVEPSLNMFYQLGVKHILEARLQSYFGIDFSVQQAKNRDLAQLASMFDKQWVTIDLSSASDSLSLKMLRSYFPRDFLTWLEALRSPYMKLPDGSQLELGMISTMGNGYTFPLQTMLFSCIVRAAHRIAGVPWERPFGQSLGNWAVYGDDIICRIEVYPHVLRLLSHLGFKVNSTKSFDCGPFRESCGGDFFKGHQVRGFYLQNLSCAQDAYVAINLLNKWTARTGIFLGRTVRLLMQMVKHESSLIYVPFAESDDAGLKVPKSSLRKILLDVHTQSVQYRFWKPIQLKIRFEKKRKSSFVNGIFGPRHLVKNLHYNPDGLLCSFLNGHISRSSVSVRHDEVTYELRTNVTPNWDYIRESDSIALSDSSLRLGNAICWNTGF